MATSDIQINNNGTWQSLFPISIEQGGTGGTDRIEAVNNILYLGRNPIGSKAEDILSFWSSKGTGFYWISENNILNGQPSQYGFLFTLCTGSDVRQWFCPQATGPVYTRSANSSSTSMPSFHSMEPYPVGAVYLSFSSTSPASTFGGTWSQISGRFLYCTTNTGTGGHNDITLTIDQIPSHNHAPQSGVRFVHKIDNTSTWTEYDITVARGGSANVWYKYLGATGNRGGANLTATCPHTKVFTVGGEQRRFNRGGQ